MCRIAAYLGPEIPLRNFLLDPDHSLMVQSWAPREMKEAKLNADGFGFGWFAKDGNPAIYTNPMPIWTDPNLDGLGRVLTTDLWLAYVRSATRRTDVSHANTQPFCEDNLLFTHNGYIDQFGETLRHHIRHALTTECEKTIHGNTDSEYLFALLRQHLAQNNQLDVALPEMFRLLTKWAGDVRLLLNIVIAQTNAIVATRHAINGDSPSLYYSVSDPLFPDSKLVASEPLTDRSNWIEVPEHHILLLSRDSEPVLTAL
ncbi:MAG: ergothioneine biosynthesis protein EgtC [Acidiferrobacterales bacterium]|nr:ergothioneine biosynthesis protein EgtC [Acidiferrobacterales bacterium]